MEKHNVDELDDLCHWPECQKPAARFLENGLGYCREHFFDVLELRKHMRGENMRKTELLAVAALFGLLTCLAPSCRAQSKPTPPAQDTLLTYYLPSVSGCSIYLLMEPCYEPVRGQMNATATAHSVNLTWSASTTVCTSPCTAITYSVFRGTTAGGENYSAPIASGLSVLSFSDTNVSLGATYYYTVEAVEAWTGAPLASAPSNEASATFPQAPTPPSGLAGTPN